MITFTTTTTRTPAPRRLGDFTTVPGRRRRGGRKANGGPAPRQPGPTAATTQPEQAKNVRHKPAKSQPAQTKPVQTQTKPPKLVTQAPTGRNAGIEERLRARGIKLWSDDPENM